MGASAQVWRAGGWVVSGGLLIATVTLMTSTSTALAQAQGSSQTITQAQQTDFDIPPQPLTDALALFGRQSGLQVSVDAALILGVQSPGVTGTLSPEQALGRLLAGTGIAYRMTGGNTALLERAVAEPESGPLRLNPLIVSGERVERTVFETSSSVVVITGEEIEDTPAFSDVEDVLDFVPNVVTAGTSNDGPSIRGVDTSGILEGGNAFLGGTRPRATITVDGRPLGFNEFIYGETSVWDLERLEVFRGPQTSAQGVNSIAGAIYVVTADPTFEPEVKVQGEIGSDEQRRMSAAFSGPIVTDELAGRVAVDFQRRDSFVNFDTTADYGPNPNEFENILARAKLLWEPAALPELSTKITFSFTQSEAPQVEQVRVPFKDLESAFLNSATWRTTAYAGIHDLSYAFSDNLEFSNRFSITDYKIERFAFPEGNGGANIDGLQLTNETNLNWQLPDQGLSGLAGVYYEQTKDEETADFSLFLGLGEFDDTRTSLGLFGEVTYDVTDRLDLTAGLRYQRDNQDRDGSFGPFTVDFDETFDALLPKFVIGYDVTDDLRVGALAVRGFNPGGTTISFIDGSQDTFEDETVWNFEAFGRARLFDDRLSLNANAFYSVYSDFQIFTIVGFTSSGDRIVEASNADKAVSYGLELTTDFQATDSFRVFAGLGLLDTEIADFSESEDPDIEGNQFERAPHVTFSIGADYELIDNLTLGGRLRYVGSYFSDADNTQDLEAGDYVVADFQLSYAYENLEAYAFVNNAFDEFYVITERQVGPGRSAIVGTPREYGVGLRISF